MQLREKIRTEIEMLCTQVKNKKEKDTKVKRQNVAIGIGIARYRWW